MRAKIAVFLLLFHAGAAWGSLQDALSNVFGDLSNATSPSFYKGHRRGAFLGGSYYARTRIMRPNLINFQPPSFKAGCGGIDLFGGSFSFISADQFVALLRNIGQAAVGYAFEIALNAICGDCLEILSDLQKKVQSLNEFFGNSCKMAQFLVDNTIGPPIEALGERVYNVLSITGASSDAFEARSKDHPVNTLHTARSDLTKKWVFGNIVWRGLKSSDAYQWFQGESNLNMLDSNGNNFLEAIMSLTGTVIVRKIDDNSDPYFEDYEVEVVPKILTVHDLLRGGRVPMWRCNGYGEDECLAPSSQNEEIEGMDTKVKKIVEEIVSGLEENSGFSSSAKNFMEHDLGLGAMIRNLSLKDMVLAKLLASKAAPIISAEITYVIATDLIRAAKIAIRKVNHPHTAEAVKILDESLQTIVQEYQKIIAERGNAKELYQFYVNLMSASPPEEKVRILGYPGASVTKASAN